MFSKKLGEWKTLIIGGAAFGFILSFITGLIGGVLFGVILLRALIFAVLFALAAILIIKLIEAFVPELLNDEDAQESFNEGNFDTDSDDAVKGSNLDVTIEDEIEDEDGRIEAVEELDEDGIVSSEYDIQSLESAKNDNSGSEEDGPVGEKTEDPEDTEEADESEESDETETPEELPDIESFSDGFDTSGANTEGLSNIDGSSYGNVKSAEVMGGMHETGEIVKAVQTVLKKDQEG